MLNKTFLLMGLWAWAMALSSPGFAEEPGCGLQECHGLKLSCGANAPEACTAMYRMGDFCRQFVSCQVVNGECRLVETREFRGCKSCVEDCEHIQEPMAAFECESQCRKEYERSVARNQG